MRKRMDQLGQENHELLEEVTYLRAEMEKLSNLVSLMAVTPPLPISTQAQTTMPSILVSTVSVSTPQHVIP